jgi:hypothetical protein
MDTFIKQMELLKKDLSALAEKKKRDLAAINSKPDQQVPLPTPGDTSPKPDLQKTAKMVVSNLVGAPNFYHDKSKDGDLPPVSRQDVKDVAKKLGIDWNSVKFTPSDLARGIQVELSGLGDKPSVPSDTADTGPLHSL